MMASDQGESSPWGWGTGSWGWGTAEDDSTHGVANEDDLTEDVIERLSAAFAPLLDSDVVTAVVRQCRSDLDDTAPPAFSDAVERLARERLFEMTAAYPIAARANTGPAAGSSAYLIIRSLAE